MKRIKKFLLGIIVLLTLLITVYQLDSIKRIIASYNHKVPIPAYMTNLKLKGTRSALYEPLTKGIIPKNFILSFYYDINGEQVIVNSKPIGEIESWNKSKNNSFSIVYRNADGNLNGINLTLLNSGDYLAEIETHYN